MDRSHTLGPLSHARTHAFVWLLKLQPQALCGSEQGLCIHPAQVKSTSTLTGHVTLAELLSSVPQWPVAKKGHGPRSRGHNWQQAAAAALSPISCRLPVPVQRGHRAGPFCGDAGLLQCVTAAGTCLWLPDRAVQSCPADQDTPPQPSFPATRPALWAQGSTRLLLLPFPVSLLCS